MPIQAKAYICELCNYNCGSKKSSYIKHLQSKKHLKQENDVDISVKSDITETTNFHSSNHDHISQPQPVQQSLPTVSQLNNNFQLNMILQDITLLKSQNLIYQNEISNLKSQVSLLESKILILNNNEIQSIKTNQQIQSILQSQNIQHIQTVAVSNTKLSSKKQVENIPSVIVEEKRKQTLTEYLNIVCKDAGEFDDFRKENKEIDIRKFVNESHINNPPNSEVTLSNYVMTYLKHISLEKLPYRCIDLQNKTVVIKIKGKWYLASDEDKNSFIDYAKSRLNNFYTKLVLDYYENESKKTENMLRQSQEYQDVILRQQKHMNEYIDIERLNRSIETNFEEQSMNMGRALSFPDVKHSFLNTLFIEVLKYCKIDMKNLEVDDLPLYFTEVVVESTQEPLIESKPVLTIEPVDNPIRTTSSLLYKTYKGNSSLRKLTKENIKMLIRIHLLEAFGYKDSSNYKIPIKKLEMSRQDFLQQLSFFQIYDNIIDILINDNMEEEDKLNFIEQEIKVLMLENTFIE